MRYWLFTLGVFFFSNSFSQDSASNSTFIEVERGNQIEIGKIQSDSSNVGVEMTPVSGEAYQNFLDSLKGEIPPKQKRRCCLKRKKKKCRKE